MPAPTNISFATAEEITSFPADISAVADFGGVTYDLYYKFTMPIGYTVVGAWAFGDLVTYQPTLRPYDSTETQILSIAALNKPAQFPATSGELYYLKVSTNVGNPTPANLTLNVQLAPNSAYVAGDILVGNADLGNPAIVYNPASDYNVRKFIVDFIISNAGSAADNLSNGSVLINQDADKTIKYLDSNLAVQMSTSYAANGSASDVAIRGNRTVNKYYFVKDVNPVIINIVSSLGVVSGTTYTLTGNNTCQALCVNNDETILYFARAGQNVAVKRWDLSLDIAMSDFISGIASTFVSDILVLSSGKILVCLPSLINQTVEVRRYASDGTLELTYDLTAQIGSNAAVARLAYDASDDTHFWIWGHVSSGGGYLSRFLKILVSDGTIVSNTLGAEFADGVYDYTATATPVARFGNHNCCPFLIFTSTPGVPSNINKIVPGSGKTNDTVGTDVAIPNPYFITAPIGG